MIIQRFSSFLIICALLAFPQVVCASSDWQWIRVEPSLFPNTPRWQILQGTSEIVFNKDKFIIKLDSDNKEMFFHYVISGTLDGERVKAKEIQLNTDAPSRDYIGFYKKTMGYDNAWKTERITITDGSAYICIIRFAKENGGEGRVTIP